MPNPDMNRDLPNRTETSRYTIEEDTMIQSRLHMNISNMTVADFVMTKFLPEHVSQKRDSGRNHYQAILKLVLAPEKVAQIFRRFRGKSVSTPETVPGWPYMSDLRIREVQPADVENLISAAMNRGYSSQTIRHIRNTVSAIFSHAIRGGYFEKANPASSVRMPEMRRKPTYSLNLSQLLRVLGHMACPEREVTLMIVATGMNVSEACGLQWRNVNLLDRSVYREAELTPPRTIAIRNQMYRGRFSSVPPSRKREIAIPPILHSVLTQLSRANGIGLRDTVFVTKPGIPINPINLAARRLKVIGKHLDMPWLGWQVLQRTREHLLDEHGIQFVDHLASELTSERRLQEEAPQLETDIRHRACLDSASFNFSVPKVQVNASDYRHDIW